MFGRMFYRAGVFRGTLDLERVPLVFPTPCGWFVIRTDRILLLLAALNLQCVALLTLLFLLCRQLSMEILNVLFEVVIIHLYVVCVHHVHQVKSLFRVFVKHFHDKILGHRGDRDLFIELDRRSFD